MFRALLILTGAAAILSCTAADLNRDIKLETAQIKTAVETLIRHPYEAAAIYIDEPRHALVELPITTSPHWFAEPHVIKSQGLPFYIVAEHVVQKHGLFVKYGPDVNINLPVHLSFDGNSEGALEALSSATGMDYRISGKDLVWSKYQIERFDLSYVGGNYNYLIGNSGGQSDQSDSTFKAVIGSNNDQYQNIKSSNINVFKEVEITLKSLVNSAGDVIVSEATASVIVKTTPARMVLVQDYMDALSNTLSKQVLLELKVLKFRNQNSAQAGIDWRLVQNSANTTLSFAGAISNQGNALFNSAPVTLSALKTAGQHNSSQLLISALQEQGSVSVVTEPRMLTQVNRVAELRVAELQGYIEKTIVTTNEAGQTSVELVPGIVNDGYSIYMIANIIQHGRIFLHVSSLLSDLLKIEVKTVGKTVLEAPRFVENSFAQTVILRPGETMIVNSLKRVVNQSDATSPLNVDSLPTYKSGAKFVEETVVLITPTIIDMGL